MKCNMGKRDRIIRFILGLAILALAVVYQPWLGVVALILLVTALVGWCPAYVPFKINTLKKSN